MFSEREKQRIEDNDSIKAEIGDLRKDIEYLKKKETQFVSGVSCSSRVAEHAKNMKRQKLGVDVQPNSHEGN